MGLDMGDDVLEVLQRGIILASHLQLVRGQLVAALLGDQALAVHHPDVLQHKTKLGIVCVLHHALHAEQADYTISAGAQVSRPASNQPKDTKSSIILHHSIC